MISECIYSPVQSTAASTECVYGTTDNTMVKCRSFSLSTAVFTVQSESHLDVPYTPLSLSFASINSQSSTTNTGGGLVWLSRDPIGERGGMNVCLATKNRPINAIDSLGLSLFDLDQETRFLQWSCGKSAEKKWESVLANFEIRNIITLKQSRLW